MLFRSLRAINPSLVYCSVTGFGQTGPYAKHAGYDYAVQGIGGLMSVTGERDDLGGGPQKVGVAVADIGLSFAKAVNVADTSLLVGLTPKIQQIQTVVYTANVDNTDFDLNKNKKTDSGVNIDLGLAKTFDDRFVKKAPELVK